MTACVRQGFMLDLGGLLSFLAIPWTLQADMLARFCKQYCIARTDGVLSWLNSIAQSIKSEPGYDTSISFNWG